LAHPPLPGGLRGCSGADGLFDFIEYSGGDHITEFRIRELPFFAQATTPFEWIFWQFSAESFDPGFIGDDGDQVRIREIPVIVGIGFWSTRTSRAVFLVPVTGLLHNSLACVQGFCLANDFGFDRRSDCPG